MAQARDEDGEAGLIAWLGLLSQGYLLAPGLSPHPFSLLPAYICSGPCLVPVRSAPLPDSLLLSNPWPVDYTRQHGRCQPLALPCGLVFLVV